MNLYLNIKCKSKLDIEITQRELGYAYYNEVRPKVFFNVYRVVTMQKYTTSIGIVNTTFSLEGHFIGNDEVMSRRIINNIHNQEVEDFVYSVYPELFLL